MKAGVVGSIIAGVVIFGGILGAVLCLNRVPVGYAGIVYSMNGGIQDEVLNNGWHIVSPTKRIFEFTIANEQLILTKDEREGSESDDSFKVSTSDDASIAISFQMSYRFKEDDLVNTFKKYRGINGEDIVNKRVKAVLKSKVSEVTTVYSMMDIYSGNRAEINDKLTEYLNKDFSETYGIEVLDASIIDVHPDKKLKAAIDNRIDAVQKKQQAKIEQETTKIEAETAQVKAKVEAETAQMKAEANAKIEVIEAQAEAEANRVKAASITDELIKMTEAEARLKHGWVTVQGSDTVVTDAK